MSHCGLVTLDGRHVDALKLEVDLKSMSKGSVLLLLTLSSLPRLAMADGVGDLLETDDKTSMALTHFIIGMMVLVFGCCCCWARRQHLEKLSLLFLLRKLIPRVSPPLL